MQDSQDSLQNPGISGISMQDFGIKAGSGWAILGFDCPDPDVAGVFDDHKMIRRDQCPIFIV